MPRRILGRHDAASTGARRGLRTWQGSIWSSLALVAIALYLRFPDGTFGDWTYLVVLFGTSAAAWVGALRSGIDRRAGMLVAAGVGLSALGDLTWQLSAWFAPPPPEVSLADVWWLSAYVFLAAALLRMLYLTRDRKGAFQEGLIDVSVIAVLVLVAEWQISVGALVADSSSPVLSRFVWALYPCFDALLIALVVRLVVLRLHLDITYILFAGGVLCWFVSDFTYLLEIAGSYSKWQDSGWLLGSLLMATAVCQRPPAAPDAHAEEQRGLGLGSVGLALLPLLVPGLIQSAAWLRGIDTNPVPLLVASVLLVALAFVRFMRLLASEAQAREQLRSSEHYFSALAANSSDAVIVLDESRVITTDSPQFANLVGSPSEATMGAMVTSFAVPVDEAESDAVFARALLSPGHVYEQDIEIIRPDGRRMWLGTRIVNLLDDPDVKGIVVNVHDTTSRKQAEQELKHQAFHDSLTGLPNRALFSDRVGQALRRDRRTRQHAAVVYLDLDGFKAVNDTLGHDAGDRLLCEVGRRLLRAVRAADTVTRLGGDEFAILIDVSDEPLEEAHRVAHRLLQALDVPVEVESQLLMISASIGIAVADDEATPSSMLRDADVAMYRAKATGKGRYVVYEPEMRTAAVEHLQLETDLVNALQEGQFRVAYQPVVSMVTGDVQGFEALLRWDHPELGVIPPQKFIPIVEQNGLIMPIGAWVLGQACRQVAQWRRQLPETRGELTIAINVSGRQIASPDLVEHVSQALDDSGLPAAALVLEMTESVLVADAELAATQLHELRDLGVRLAIDDFGTGYSSLSYLRQFPVDILKVDRSFVAMITDRNTVPAIVRGLLDLSRTMGLETVAEGVEDDVQREALLSQGCDLAQGYLFARPLSPSDAWSLLDNEGSEPSTGAREVVTRPGGSQGPGVPSRR